MVNKEATSAVMSNSDHQQDQFQTGSGNFFEDSASAK